MNPFVDFDPVRRLVATYGRFKVWLDPLVHLPYGLYRVYSAGKYVGAQISFPGKSDCEWLQHGKVFYAYGHIEHEKQKARGVITPAYKKWRREKRAA